MNFVFKTLYQFYLRLFRPYYHASLNSYIHTDETAKYIHLTEALNYLKVAGNKGKVLPLTYYEFGCHSARTFSAAVNAAEVLSIENTQFFAFDSFQGLPETNPDIDGIFTTSSFCTTKKKFINKLKKKTRLASKTKFSNIRLIEGFYNTSLTQELLTTLPPAGVVHIDVDLYSSCNDVLNFITPLLVNGSILLFDDIYTFPINPPQGEALAIKEFLERNQHIQLIPWKAYSSFGQSFFVKIKLQHV